MRESEALTIDFADNCTLETLQKKLRHHQYHLVYLAGQGGLKGGEAHLLMEDGELFRQTMLGEKFRLDAATTK